MRHVIELLNQYGYIVLFTSLILELIAFPLPGEALMTYCGYIIYQQKMNWGISVLVATLGVVIGVTLSHFIGKILGIAFFENYGHYIHLNKKRLENISKWFDRFGNKLLIIAYFIPGVRHIAGYFSGITKVSYKKFAINAYFGAVVWTTTFITLGEVLGANWGKYHSQFKIYSGIGSIIIIAVIAILYLYKIYKNKMHQLAIKFKNNIIKAVFSFRNISTAITQIRVSFLVFFAVIMKIIQKYLVRL